MGAILPYQHIKKRCQFDSLVTPFAEKTDINGMSYGCAEAGYDVRLDQDLLLGPHVFKKGSTFERIRMPHDLLATVRDKSTWARVGVHVFNTVIDPGWEGYLTLEIVNHSEHEVFIESGWPIAQLIFAELVEPTNLPYRGKYNIAQQGVTEAIYGETPVYTRLQDRQEALRVGVRVPQIP